MEIGDGGFEHWQIVVGFKKPIRLRGVRELFGNYHAEPSKSDAADEYVWKEETRVEGTQFLLGKKAFQRGSSKDWDQIAELAKAGQFDEIPSDILIRHYGNLRRISSDYSKPIPMEREVKVYWGATGTGKSRRAWDEAGFEAYPKDPRTKFWDGYRGQENVVIDEFRGSIDIAHLLRWLDRYPVIVEIKCSSVVLSAKKIWITTNLAPIEWFPFCDEKTVAALMRRLIVEEIK